jgi:hypothetical protein
MFHNMILYLRYDDAIMIVMMCLVTFIRCSFSVVLLFIINDLARNRQAAQKARMIQKRCQDLCQAYFIHQLISM